MSFEAFSTIALTGTADRGASCIGDDGIWYGVPRNGSSSGISRIDTATNTALPDLSTGAIGNVRQIDYVDGYLYIGTYVYGVWRVDPTTGSLTNLFYSFSNVFLASVVYGGKIHYFTYFGQYYIIDPQSSSYPSVPIAGGPWVTADGYENYAFVLPEGTGDCKLVDLDTGTQTAIAINSGTSLYKDAGTSNGKLFIPQIGSNKLHVFDWESKTILPSLTLPANVNTYAAVIADEEEVRVLYEGSYVSVDPVNMTVNPTPVALPITGQWYGVSYATNGGAYVGATNGSTVLFAASDYVPPPVGPTSKIWNGEEWVESQPKVIWNGSSWQPVTKVEVRKSV